MTKPASLSSVSTRSAVSLQGSSFGGHARVAAQHFRQVQRGLSAAVEAHLHHGAEDTRLSYGWSA